MGGGRGGEKGRREKGLMVKRDIEGKEEEEIFSARDQGTEH